MKEQLKAFLAMEGYTPVESNLPEFLVFLKKEYRHVSVLFVIELEDGSTFTTERYQSVYESACKLLEKDGVTEMHILTLLIADNPELALEVSREDKYAWIIHREKRALIIEEGKAQDFYGLKAVFERFLQNPDEARQKIQEAEEFVLRQLKEQEKKYNPKPYIPWVACCLVAINIVIYIVCTSTGDLLYTIGEMSLMKTLGEGQWYRVVTSMFLHGNLSHLLNNMLILYLLGNMIEERIGRWKFGAYYFLCGIVAGLVSLTAKYFTGIDANSIGASGAVYGIFGIALITELVSIDWRHVQGSTLYRMLLVMLCMIVSLYTDARMEMVDYEAHVGGLSMGILIGALWYLNQFRKKRKNKHED